MAAALVGGGVSRHRPQFTSIDGFVASTHVGRSMDAVSFAAAVVTYNVAVVRSSPHQFPQTQRETSEYETSEDSLP